MKNVILTEGSWSKDRNSVDVTIYDDKNVSVNPEFLGVKENTQRLNIFVGKENWGRKLKCVDIIQENLNKKGFHFTNQLRIS